MSRYILFHRDTDGAFAAASAYSIYGENAKYISVQYGEPFPIKNLSTVDEVFIVDFSYEKVMLDEVYAKVSKLIVLDHHASAELQLKGTPYSTFDMNKCGSTLAWEYFRTREEMPEIYHLVEDRDLFRYQYDDTDLVTEGLRIHDLTDIKTLAKLLETPDEFLKSVIRDGKPLLKSRKLAVYKNTAKRNVVLTDLLGSSAAIINESTYISDSASALLSKYETDIAVCWFASGSSIIFSLRSVGDIDVSVLAAIKGGGGHFHAAGFKLDMVEGLELVAFLYSGSSLL